MTERQDKADAPEQQAKDDELPFALGKIQGAIWLIGLAILAWQGWWWPGILVLVAISGLTEAGLKWYANKQQHAQTVAAVRRTAVPATCPNCGSPITADTVKWTSETTAACPYCGTVVTAT
ncbi:MAG: hypothetical protein KDD83_11340 [Caldilineaceae bacterium]|nr:hypothetical protein [Caldilineaceae bacterium]